MECVLRGGGVRGRVALHHPFEAWLLDPEVLHAPRTPHRGAAHVQTWEVHPRTKPCSQRHTEGYFQRWEVVEYKYFVTVFKYIFYILNPNTCTFYFLHVEHKYLYFLLLTRWTQIPVLSTSYMLNTNTCTFYFLHVEPKYLYFLLLTCWTQIPALSTSHISQTGWFL